jgi:hypothetical protein
MPACRQAGTCAHVLKIVLAEPETPCHLKNKKQATGRMLLYTVLPRKITIAAPCDWLKLL